MSDHEYVPFGSEAVSASLSEAQEAAAERKKMHLQYKLLQDECRTLRSRLAQSETQRMLLEAENKKLRKELSAWIDLPF